MKKIIIALSLFLTLPLIAQVHPDVVDPGNSPEPGVPAEKGPKLVKVIYVKEKGSGNLSGSGWDNACRDIQDAINKAADAAKADGTVAEVWIAKGTYKHGSTIWLKENVLVFGGFSGTEKEWSEDENLKEYPNPDFDPYVEYEDYTDQDCSGKYVVPIGRRQRTSGNFVYVDGEGRYSVFIAQGVSSKLKRARLDSLIIQNGNSSNALAGGGGLYVLNFYLTVSNCTFVNNHAMFSGGAIFNHDEFYDGTDDDLADTDVDNEYLQGSAGQVQNHLELFNCTFYSNSADYYGGAIANGDVKFNTNGNGYGGSHGVHEEPNSSIIARNCTFTKNTAKLCGGAVYDNAGSVFINCIFWNDIALGNGNEKGKGNEIYLDKESEQIIKDCVVALKYQKEYGVTTDGIVDNDIPGLISHQNIIDKNPRLLPLGDYGGNVLTCAVEGKSSAVKAGSLSEEVLKDARGVGRSIDKPTIGAYEYFPLAFESYTKTATVYEGGNIELSVDVDKREGMQLYYQWYRYYGGTWKPCSDKTYLENTDGIAAFKYENIKETDKEFYDCYYKCVVTSERLKSTLETNSIKISFVEKPEIIITEDTKNTKLAVCVPTGASEKISDADRKMTISLKVTGAKKLEYQWQYRNVGGSDWTDITKSENKTAVTTKFVSDCMNLYDFTENQKEYRLCVSAKNYTPAVVVYSDVYSPVQLTRAEVKNHPQDCVCTTTENAVFTVVATPVEDKNIKYQWQVSSDGGKTWKNAGTKQTLTVTRPNAKMSGNLYRCLVSNKINPKDPSYSNVATLTVRAPAQISKQPQLLSANKSKVVYKGDSMSAEVVATGYNTQYQWQYSIDGKTWVNISGATESKLEGFDTSFIDMPNNKSTTSIQLRCQAWSEDEGGSMLGMKVLSSPLRVTLNEKVLVKGYSFRRGNVDLYDLSLSPDAIEGIDSTSGVVVYAFAEYPFEMIVSASGYNPKYQWQYSSDGIAWENIAGARKKNYKVNILDESDSGFYRCVVSNDGGVVNNKYFELVAMGCYVKKELSGYAVKGYTDFMGGAFFNAIFVDKQKIKIKFDNDLVLENSTYSIKRTSPTESTFSLSFKCNGVSYSMSGALDYDNQTDTLVGFLKDKKSGMVMRLEIDESKQADPNSYAIPQSAKNLVGNKLSFGNLTIAFVSQNKCNIDSPSMSLDNCSYSYKNNKNGIAVLTITGKDKYTNTTYKGESVLFEFESGIYTEEITDANKQRVVEIFNLE